MQVDTFFKLSDAFLEEVEGRDIPICIIFRLLGIESDKKILNNV